MTTVYPIWYLVFDTRKERTLFWSAKIKMRILSVNVKIDPHEYVYQGFPSIRESEVDPQMITTVYSIWYLNFGTRKERTVFWWGKIKTHTLSTNVKIYPQEYVFKGFSSPWESEGPSGIHLSGVSLHNRKWIWSSDDNYCLLGLVSIFRYPKGTNCVLIGEN